MVTIRLLLIPAALLVLRMLLGEDEAGRAMAISFAGRTRGTQARGYLPKGYEPHCRRTAAIPHRFH
ncbi:hypothetical protein OG195_37840 [Streptomyces sp. NBC_01362]|uniref:hypothetical protein n=1 Tax=Streptomyces sp. NBC_01362 TaxID=2903839 RepID=UPI002E348E9A|nr:hypothetical protein [Streptomyces sp. NBC_01362]